MERYAGSTPAYRIPTEREMKNFVIAVMLLIALSLYFSCCGNTPLETALHNSFGTQYKGDSGLVVPADGDLLADAIIIEPELVPELSQTIEETKEEKAISKELTPKEKEYNNMEGMLLSFWHGVAAVLIGETAALMIALAWMKIKKNQ